MSAATGSEGYGFLVKMRSDPSRHPRRRDPDERGHGKSAMHAVAIDRATDAVLQVEWRHSVDTQLVRLREREGFCRREGHVFKP
jgi:hypothetical protein